jgi:KDO2-lipid IV(A) lauroyltransferase
MSTRKPKFHPLIDAPLSTIARLGMLPVGAMGYERAMRAADALNSLYIKLDRKHYKRALDNLRDAYPQWNQDQLHACAVGCHRHLLQLGVEFVYTPRLLTADAVHKHLIFTDLRKPLASLLANRPTILISGHIGNWELVGYAVSMLGFEMCAVYRPLDLRGMDAWIKQSRESKGLRLMSKFGAARGMPTAIEAGFPVGLVADQSGGDRGVFTPFFGRLTSTYKMIGLLAMRFGATIACGVARRLESGDPSPTGPWEQTLAGHREIARLQDPRNELRYAVEVTDTFGPEDWNSQPDPLYYITARYRRAMEMMVRRAPNQYFWMHRIWRSRPAHERLGKPFPNALREKMSQLPWMTDADVAAVVDRSERDARDLDRLQRA